MAAYNNKKTQVCFSDEVKYYLSSEPNGLLLEVRYEGFWKITYVSTSQ